MTLERVTRTYLGLPDQAAMRDLLGGKVWHAVGELAENALITPAREMAARPSKHFRAQLVRMGFALVKDQSCPADETKILAAAAAIELLHTGSLIVDDIQDQSPMRRGSASLHRMYGIPGALCAGNWLYFRPLKLLEQLGLPLEREHQAFKLYHEALELAHYGQALDLTIKVDQLSYEEIPAVCEAVGELKTGSITALAMSLGALVADAPLALVAEISAFGRRFGTALQQCDDVGSLTSPHADPEKKYEDLLQRKPSAVWSLAVQLFPQSMNSFTQAVAAVHDQPSLIQDWLTATDFATQAFYTIRKDLDDPYRMLASRVDIQASALDDIKSIGDQLIDAYR